MIGKVGAFLGEHKINIASMDVGRLKVDEKAVMVLNVDGAVSDKVLSDIAELDGIFGATIVKV
jgi:D-3-phosphoglycerate dehydrogenase